MVAMPTRGPDSMVASMRFGSLVRGAGVDEDGEQRGLGRGVGVGCSVEGVLADRGEGVGAPLWRRGAFAAWWLGNESARSVMAFSMRRHS